MIVEEQIVSIAYSWLNTPYHNQARLKGIGVDCAQLVAGIYEELSGNSINTPVYSPEWHLHNKEEKMLNILESFGCEEVDLQEIGLGKIITFKFGRVQSHLGIMVSEEEFIHARLDIGKVVKNQLSGDWKQRLGKCYKFPHI